VRERGAVGITAVVRRRERLRRSSRKGSLVGPVRRWIVAAGKVESRTAADLDNRQGPEGLG
jgi:hypothetical protein